MVTPDGKYWNARRVEAVGEEILYVEGGIRYESGDVMVVAPDSCSKWIFDCAEDPRFYLTLCGQKMSCGTAEEKADDLLARAYMLAKSGALDDYFRDDHVAEALVSEVE